MSYGESRGGTHLRRHEGGDQLVYEQFHRKPPHGQVAGGGFAAECGELDPSGRGVFAAPEQLRALRRGGRAHLQERGVMGGASYAGGDKREGKG